MSEIFLETSALLRALFGEAGGDEVRSKMIFTKRIFASRLLLVETERVLLRVDAFYSYRNSLL
ncbi:MAG: hypothetical protein JW841_13260 [Deltaproteobacteria bacterium]|nr:hypothetical protein [Deltaproteobacteria bacterium]